MELGHRDSRLAHHQEQIEGERLARRKKENEERRLRLLNPNERLCGRDEVALQAQIAERKAAKQREISEDYEYARKIAEINASLDKADAERRERNRDYAKQLQQQHLSEAQRRSEEKEAEVAEYHRQVLHVGPSSVQHFEGEDPGAARRRELQAAQMRRFVEQGNAQRREREEQERDLERQHAAHVERLVNEQEKAEREKQEEVLRRKKEVQLYNQLQAKIKADEKAFNRALSVEQERVETAEPFLSQPQTEDPSQYASVVAPHRVRPDHFRGIGSAALETIRGEQRQQMEEKRMREQHEEEMEQRYAQQQQRLHEESCYISHQEQEARRTVKRNILFEQQKQIEEKRLARESKAAEDSATAPFSDAFFGSFGTSHR